MSSPQRHATDATSSTDSPSPRRERGPGGEVTLTTLKSTSDTTIDPRYLSTPETLEYPTTLDGQPTTAFAFYYPPHNADYQDELPLDHVAEVSSPRRHPASDASPSTPMPGGSAPGTATSELPPLLVISHGGPTAATSAVLSPRIQYWTSRGIAVLDVNYGGSTGYGTAYRRRLNRRWGIVDVDDCVNAARYLVARGDVDPARLAITGGSAGGYTTLCALTMRHLFSAGASYYGVAELEALARDTHKFESRYLDGLIGPYPADAPNEAPGPEDVGSEAPPEAGVSRGQGPMRGEPEGSPLGKTTSSTFSARGAAQSDAQRGDGPGGPGGSAAAEPGSTSPGERSDASAGAVGAQPPRGESEGSPLSSQLIGAGGGAAPSDAQPGSPDAASAASDREALLAPYRQRSPINHVDDLDCPVIFFQGLEDQIVPPNQAQMMVEALQRKGIPVAYFTFEGEQHGFRRAENIKRSLEAELLFYGRIFNFTPADNIAPFPISNLFLTR